MCCYVLRLRCYELFCVVMCCYVGRFELVSNPVRGIRRRPVPSRFASEVRGTVVCAWLVCRAGVRALVAAPGALGLGGGRGWRVGLGRVRARGWAGRCVVWWVCFSVVGGEEGFWWGAQALWCVYVQGSACGRVNWVWGR